MSFLIALAADLGRVNEAMPIIYCDDVSDNDMCKQDPDVMINESERKCRRPHIFG